jgi:transcriptional regulator NrdR family protein
MKCPKCCKAAFKVSETRLRNSSKDGHFELRRTRHCDRCGYRVFTIETERGRLRPDMYQAVERAVRELWALLQENQGQ